MVSANTSSKRVTSCGEFFGSVIDAFFFHNAYAQMLFCLALTVLSVLDEWNIYTLSLDEWRNLTIIGTIAAVSSASVWISRFFSKKDAKTQYAVVASKTEVTENACDKGVNLQINAQMSLLLALMFIIVVLKAVCLSNYATGSATRFHQDQALSFTSARKLALLQFIQHTGLVAVVNCAAYFMSCKKT